MMRRLAGKLARFHEEAETSRRIAEYGDWAIRYNQRENERQWAPYIGRTVTPEQDRILRAYSEAFYARKAEVMRRRVEERRIRRVHADLRSDAVCFVDGICVFDCVEFSRRVSLLDVARDVGFLTMDLDYRGHSDLAGAFVERYLAASRDTELSQVLDFYACYSACVRGKVEAFLLDQPEVPKRRQREAARSSRRYFALACRYAEELPPALLVITCGLAASGKSSLARRLAGAAGFEVVSSDVVRKELAGIEATEHRYERFEGGIYGPEFTRRTYAELLARARPLLREGRSVILDASFLRREQRRAAARLARDEGAQFACIECRIEDATARARIERRLREGWDPSDARWGIYVVQKRRFQRPSEVPPERLISVAAEKPLGSEVRRVLRELKALSPLSVT
jgi:predicted kinase